jgi:hypothetical protein
MSQDTWWNACDGNGTGRSGGDGFRWLCVWHVTQLATMFRICSSHPGQYTANLALRIHFSSPKCPSWIPSMTSGRRDTGTTSRLPYKSNPSTSEREWRTPQNSFAAIRQWDLCSVSNFSLVDAFGMTWSSTAWTCSSLRWVTSSLNKLGDGALLSVSAMSRLLPGLYTSLKSNCCVLCLLSIIDYRYVYYRRKWSHIFVEK